MTRGLRALGTGLATALAAAGAVGAGAVGAGAARAAADGSGPVATAPSTPAVQTVTGVTANGVQLELSLPKQLPVDLPGQQLSAREVDVTVRDVAGQGYSGTVDVTVTAEGAGVTRQQLRIDHYDPAAGTWRQVPAPPSTGASLTASETVTVPAGGSAQVRLRVSPGTTPVDDVKVSATANGAGVVGTAPVTEPTFQSSGLTGAVKAGTPQVLTGRLMNPTDVDYRHVPVTLSLKACPAPPAKCLGPADVKLEAQVGGAWQQVDATPDPAGSGGLSATVFPDLSLAPGGSVQLAARVTLNSGAVPVNPVPLAFGPSGLTVAASGGSGSLTVQPIATPTPTPTPTPTSASTSSSIPAATPSSSDSSPSDSGSSTAGATSSATSAAAATATTAATAVAAGTPTAAASGNDTLLVAVGLFAVCLALVLLFVLMKRRERLAAAARRAAEYDDED